MKKENLNGRISLKSDYLTKFSTFDCAMREFQAIQLYYSNLGYLTTSTINVNYHKVELCVHFETFKLSRSYSFYVFLFRVLTSHTYWNEYWQQNVRVRCCTFYFEF